ncbi:MAG: four helix bundle protein [Patescibacteria group bacterium]
MIKKFEDLTVYQKALGVVMDVYHSTKEFPTEEKFGLVNQMRKCAVSITSNIAEGSMRLGSLEFKRFISIARGSVGELRSQVQISKELGFLNPKTQEKITADLDEVGKMLTALARSLKNKSNTNA